MATSKHLYVRGLIALLVTAPSLAGAHPVAYQGSLGIMTSHSPSRTDIGMNYSVTNRVAIGTDYIRIPYRRDEAYFGIARLNGLLYRANRPESQGNIYAYTGTGFYERRGERKVPLFFGGEADWESRKHYVSFRSQCLRVEGQPNFDEYRLRAGIAPYVADFESIHTWLIGELMYEPYARNEFSAAPLLRLFYRNVLWETGVTTRGEFLFNTIIHF